MAAGLRVGVNQALFYNAGSYGTPTWTEVTGAIDVSLNIARTLAEVKARSSIWVGNLPALASADLTFDMIGDTSLTPYNVIRDAVTAGTLVDLAVCDDAAIATSGADYFRADYYLDSFALKQGLEEAEKVDISGKLAYSASHTPAWTDVA